jgi:hypothetical protein
MHDNPYYKSSQNPYEYTECVCNTDDVNSIQDPGQKLSANSHTAQDSGSPQNVSEESNHIGHSVVIGLQSNGQAGGSREESSGFFDSGNWHSTEMDSYCRPDAMDSKTPCERNSLCVSETSAAQNSTSSKSVDEFGYCQH